jgi:hypothetical protein
MVGGIFCSVSEVIAENDTNKHTQKVEFLYERYKIELYFLEKEGIVSFSFGRKGGSLKNPDCNQYKCSQITRWIVTKDLAVF